MRLEPDAAGAAIEVTTVARLARTVLERGLRPATTCPPTWNRRSRRKRTTALPGAIRG
jgi:hypothetical protein